MKPNDLILKLKENASAKTTETLDAIYQICQEQKDRGIDDFSVTTISRLGSKRGVPKAQSIRNKAGESYRALIQSFADNNSTKGLIKSTKKEDDWIEEITNPKHKLLARIQASELKVANQKLREIIPPNTRINVYDYKNAAPTDIKLTDQERRALEYLISPTFQKKWNFHSNEYGELVDINNNPVFKVATLDAIKKTLEHL
jgi:hypothetical protein